jgi:hypothetical protein
VCRHRELEPAIAAGALIEAWSCPTLAHVAAGYSDRAFVATGGTDPALRPHHAFQQPTARLLILEGRDHSFNSPNAGKRRKHFRHLISLGSCPKNRMKSLDNKDIAVFG